MFNFNNYKSFGGSSQTWGLGDCLFGTISFTVGTFGQQQGGTQRVLRGRGEVLIPFLAQSFRKNACLVCTLDRIFHMSQMGSLF